ncbi:uncharacterized protein J3D65DRAFT_615991 [Phyllosticta citribraziliensis]|uniref:Condensation domain-containing protein n=1 Tax=Phyllosticta citribraziliensis TaxID=989973 RepID=A0ABR1LZK7_9PEZI
MQADHWLSRYASDYHAWRKVYSGQDLIAYQRPLGLVETAFDIDGIHYGGRADVNSAFTVEARTSLTVDDFRQRITLAWANLRILHVLLMATVVRDSAFTSREFKLEIPASSREAVENAASTIRFLQNSHERIEIDDFFKHCTNSGRVIDSDKSLSELLVLPSEPLHGGTFRLTFFLVAAHETCDGLVLLGNWWPHFLRLLNTPVAGLERSLEHERLPQRLWARLPRAQEDLYPRVQGSIARQRWYWAIMRVLRHVRKPPPQGFFNPLKQAKRRDHAILPPPKYPDVFEYSEEKKPPINGHRIGAVLSRTVTDRLERLARAVGASVGAACFALVGLSMMELEEAKNPQVPLEQRQPFVGSFPINPRPFFGFTSLADSCMLTFSDGIWLPFLPSDLPVEARLRLLIRQAHRQLGMYQKRLRSDKLKGSWDPTDPARVIASSYLVGLERIEDKKPEHLRSGISPQGAYPAKWSLGTATCGISSMGSVKKFLQSGKYKLDEKATEETGFVADYRSCRTCVRARDGEFLVGVSGMDDGMTFDVSYDGNEISEEVASFWRSNIESILEPNVVARL